MTTLPTDRTWRRYGKKEPYFGVFGQPEYLRKNLNENTLDDFFSSGKEYSDELFRMIREKIDPHFRPRSILDFGCGPGRMIIPFSAHAEEIFALDISPAMLEEAAANCRKHGIRNVTFRVADDRLDCLHGKRFDLVHTFIVLQHLRVRRGERLFSKLTGCLVEGGIGILHVTYSDRIAARRLVNFFRFRIPYLCYPLRIFSAILLRKSVQFSHQMQMNNYRLNRLFSLLQESGVEEVLAIFTDHHGYRGVTLCFRKPPGG